MILAALLALQAAPAPPPTDDVVVIGRREQLQRVRMTTRRDRRTGVTRCVFKRRSGDPALDATVCNAVLACVPKVATEAEMRACLAPTMDALVAGDSRWQANVPR